MAYTSAAAGWAEWAVERHCRLGRSTDDQAQETREEEEDTRACSPIHLWIRRRIAIVRA